MLREVYRAASAADAHLLRAELTALGFDAHVHGETLESVTSHIPFFHAQPTVHVPDDQADDARIIVAEWSEHRRSPAEPGPDWQCPACGETVEGVFTACWSCGAGVEEDSADDSIDGASDHSDDGTALR
ncbi:MAG: DUF2007 domain-containing protein [Planctomycetota bacterium]